MEIGCGWSRTGTRHGMRPWSCQSTSRGRGVDLVDILFPMARRLLFAGRVLPMFFACGASEVRTIWDMKSNYAVDEEDMY